VFELSVWDGCTWSDADTVVVNAMPRPCIDVPVFNDTGVISRNYDYLSIFHTEEFTLRGSNLFRREEYYAGVGFGGVADSATRDFRGQAIEEYATFTQNTFDMRWQWDLVEYRLHSDNMQEDPCAADDVTACACDPECSMRELRANAFDQIKALRSFDNLLDDTAHWWFGLIMGLLLSVVVIVAVLVVRARRNKAKAE
jgi:hypothetical protein